MGLTFHYFVRTDKVITQQYPENRNELKMPERYRGKIELVKDPENGGYKCNACGLCLKACPNGSISIEKMRDPQTKGMKLVKYQYRLDRCTLCGLCVDACHFEALKMGTHFESAVFDRSQLVQVLNEGDPAAHLPPPEGQTQPKEKPTSPDGADNSSKGAA